MVSGRNSIRDVEKIVYIPVIREFGSEREGTKKGENNIIVEHRRNLSFQKIFFVILFCKLSQFSRMMTRKVLQKVF